MNLQKCTTLPCLIVLMLGMAHSQGHAQYCTPLYDVSNPCSPNNIKSFVLPGDAGTGINNVGSVCNTSGYTDYTSSMSVTLSQGYPYTGTISTDYDKTNFAKYSFARIWVDFNKNEKFEDSEEIAQVTEIVKSTSPKTFNFTILPTRPVGTYRMRVRLVYANDVTVDKMDPCNTYFFGHTHDYEVVIVAPGCTGKPEAKPVTAPAIVCPGVSFDLETGNLASGTTGQWQSSTDSLNWTNISGAMNEQHTVSAGIQQHTYFRFVVDCAASGLLDTSDAVKVTIPEILQIQDDERCGAGRVEVVALGNAGSEIYWYLNASGGALTATGAALVRPTLSQTDTFYAEVGLPSGQCANMPREAAVALVTESPAIALGNDTNICEGTSLRLDAGIDDVPCVWNTGDINRYLDVAEEGTYIVTAKRGVCPEVADTIQVQIDSLPIADHISVTEKDSLEYEFEVSGDKYVTSYVWDFGDGNSDTGRSVTHVYEERGTYQVSLAMANECADITLAETIEMSVTVETIGKNYSTVQIYPNPANDYLYIESRNGAGLGSLVVKNIQGQVVKRDVVSGSTCRMNIGALPAGVYIIHMVDEAGHTQNLKVRIGQ